MKLFIIISLFLSLFLPKTKPILQKTYNSQCPNCPPQISLGSTRKIPVYVPIPVFTLYQIPILHHYPLNQVVRQMTPIPIEIPIEHRINRPYPIPIPVEQKILIPQPVPYGVKVPIPIPIQRKCENCDNNGTDYKNKTDNNYRNLSIQINNLVQQSLKADFDRFFNISLVFCSQNF